MNTPHRTIDRPGMRILVYPDQFLACAEAADRIASTITSSILARGKAVLGLATGSTPVSVYSGLVGLWESRFLDAGNVFTYNLDEYYPMSPVHPESYRNYMDRHLFSKVAIPPNQAHVLDGTVPEPFAAEHTAQFDRWLEADGGLDLQLLGLGRNAHIGFNEPSSLPVDQAMTLPTRMVELHPTTIADAARDFGGQEHVPRRALTMGVASILAARSILVLAFGPNKSEAVARSIDGPITAEVPGSLLKTLLGKVTFLLDESSASQLE